MLHVYRVRGNFINPCREMNLSEQQCCSSTGQVDIKHYKGIEIQNENIHSICRYTFIRKGARDQHHVLKKGEVDEDQVTLAGV